MNLTASKIFSASILGISSFLLGIIPVCCCFSQQSGRSVIISCLLCFGGGVLLSTSLVHILPELRESVPADYQKYAEIVYCCGFFILYLIDEIVHYCYGNSQEGDSHVLHDNNRSNYGAIHATQSLPTETSSLTHSHQRDDCDRELISDETPSQLCHVNHQEPCNAAPISSLGLLTALSVHALLEGLVVGLENTSDKVLLLLGAIASHKLVVSFCLGVELTSASMSRTRHSIYVFIFSVGSAVGIIVGMVISDIPEGIKNVAIPILQGFAGGTLLYVTVSEVLPRERARWHKQHERRSAGVFQFLSVFAGFAVMTALINYLDYDG